MHSNLNADSEPPAGPENPNQNFDQPVNNFFLSF